MKQYQIFDDLYFCARFRWIEVAERTAEKSIIPNRFVVVFLEKGEALFNIDDNLVKVTDSQMLLLHPHQTVFIHTAHDDTEISLIGFTVALQDIVLKQFSMNFFTLLREKRIWDMRPRTKQALQAFYDLFDFNYSNSMGAFSTEIASSLFSIFLQMFYQLVKDQLDTTSVLGKPLNTRSLGGKFFVLLNDKFKEQHSVSFYANELCISSKYLTQIVKNMTAMTPKEIIDKRLGTEALFLLTKTPMNIQEISNELGFPDQSYFGRFFKRIFGMSPLNYRLNQDLGLLEKV